MSDTTTYVPKRGDRRRFTTDVNHSGWSFTAGDVVTFVDTVPDLDWFAHLVRTETGQSRKIGAGILARATVTA